MLPSIRGVREKFLNSDKKKHAAGGLSGAILGRRSGIDADLLAMPPHGLKGHNTVYLGEQGIIPADTHVLPGVEFGAPLADQNTARAHVLACKTLNTKALSGTVPSVPGTSDSLLMSHDILLVQYRVMFLSTCIQLF
jgi:hypothetical protein